MQLWSHLPRLSIIEHKDSRNTMQPQQTNLCLRDFFPKTGNCIRKTVNCIEAPFNQPDSLLANVMQIIEQLAHHRTFGVEIFLLRSCVNGSGDKRTVVAKAIADRNQYAPREIPLWTIE